MRATSLDHAIAAGAVLADGPALGDDAAARVLAAVDARLARLRGVQGAAVVLARTGTLVLATLLARQLPGQLSGPAQRRLVERLLTIRAPGISEYVRLVRSLAVAVAWEQAA